MNEFDFEGKIYTVGKVYRYSDLPETSQDDARNTASTEMDPGGEKEAKKYVYEFTVIPYKKAEKVAEKISKDISVSDLSINRARELARDISMNYLQAPPTGAEGFHRLLALVYLRMDVPYFRMIEKKTGKSIRGAFFPR